MQRGNVDPFMHVQLEWYGKNESRTDVWILVINEQANLQSLACSQKAQAKGEVLDFNLSKDIILIVDNVHKPTLRGKVSA